MRPKPLTVWDVMIPIIFIMNYMDSKKRRELFAENLMFTKKLALEAARDLLGKGQSREQVSAMIEQKTSSVLASENTGLYSEEIRQSQIKEIDVLIDHYLKLLNAEGKDYSSLVINAYQSKRNYGSFLNKLKAVEKEVILAAKQTLGAQTDPGLVSKMEDATDTIRMVAVDKIFGT
jgi:hypothetical protein